MAKIKTLKQGEDQIIPKTLAQAVSTSDGSNVQIELDNLKSKIGEVPDVSGQINSHNSDPEAHESIRNSINTHISDKNNPHQVTAEQVGADATGSAAQALVDAKSYTDQKVAAIPTPDVSAQINAHNIAEDAHANKNWVTNTTVEENINTHNTSIDAHANKHWLTSSDEELSEIIPGEPIDADTLQGHPASYFATKDDLAGITVDVDLSDYVTNDALNLQLQNYALKTEVQTLTEQLSTLTTRVTNIENEINGVAAKIDEINGEVI